METRQIPVRVEQSEVDRALRMAGKDSAVYRRVAEQRQDWLAWEAQRKVENDRLRAEREAREAEEAKTRAAAREAERKAAEASVKAEARARFAVANPTATDEDFERLWPQLRDRQMVDRMHANADADRAELMTRHDYGM